MVELFHSGEMNIEQIFVVWLVFQREAWLYAVVGAVILRYIADEMYSHLYVQFLMKSDQIVVKDGKLMDRFFPAADGVAESCQVIG